MGDADRVDRAAPPGPTNDCCWTDADCSTRNEKQCGHGLFDLTPARNNPTGHVITLDWDIKRGATRKRRGVCPGEGGAPCENESGGHVCPNCRGYSLGIQ